MRDLIQSLLALYLLCQTNVARSLLFRVCDEEFWSESITVTWLLRVWTQMNPELRAIIRHTALAAEKAQLHQHSSELSA